MEFNGIESEVVLNALLEVSILAIFVERALSVLFESRWFIEKTGEQKSIEVTGEDDMEIVTEKVISKKKNGIKELIALMVSVGVAWSCEIDVIGAILCEDCLGWFGYILTGGVIAGGTKGSVKLFRDVLGIMSVAEKEKKQRRDQGSV